MRTNGATDSADRHRVAGRFEAGAVAPHLIDPDAEFETEGRRLGVDAMRAARAERVTVLHGLAFEDDGKGLDVLQQQIGGVAQLEAGGSVPDVGAGEPEVHVSAFLTEGFGNGAEEGGDVVVGDADVLVDLVDIEAGVAADLRGGGGGYLAEFGPRLAGRDLDVEPSLELVLLAPDGGHFGAGVARDHLGTMISEGTDRNYASQSGRRIDCARGLRLLRTRRAERHDLRR